jgi:protein-tyrosine phosphatase
VTGPFGILFVCTGNVCRSPVAESLTRRLLAHRLGPLATECFAVASAGTHAVWGAGVHPHTVAALAGLGIADPPGNGSARPLDAALVRTADLVLTAERSHRSFVVGLEPSALPVTFCLREFARLIVAVDRTTLPSYDPVARAVAVVAGARSLRGTLAYSRPADDDVPDPVRGAAGAHRSAAGLVHSAVSVVVDVLTTRP